MEGLRSERDGAFLHERVLRDHGGSAVQRALCRMRRGGIWKGWGRMERQEKTKYRLAEAARECLKTTPVDSLTVTQIVNTCGIARQTFYRSFLDKYDLINWYFGKLLLESFAQMGDGEAIRESLTKKFEFILKEQVFFAAAFRSDDRNSLRQHDYELIFDFYEKLIRRKTGRAPAEEIAFQLRLYCRGGVDMTVEWLLSPRRVSPQRLAALMVEAMPQKLSRLFAELGILG